MARRAKSACIAVIVDCVAARPWAVFGRWKAWLQVHSAWNYEGANTTLS